MESKTLQDVVVVLRRLSAETDDTFQERLDELIGLCEAAGGRVIAHVSQARDTIDRALYIGSGKVIEVAELALANDAQVIVFDNELSPGQIRNLEQQLPCRVIDRTQLILDIFALRARSREGMLQIEIAQLQYLLPRLTGRGVELSRLGGGIGTRGPGETKLEMDRRHIRERIRHLRERLKELEGRREVQRNRRSRSTPSVALVGYTNAGKTTLLQRWTADRGVTNGVEGGNSRLFDTLDPLARRVKSGATGELVILDTVGFVQNLPHLLVNSFRATLEEVTAVDLIIHVVDATHATQERLDTTYSVLREVDALGRPIVTFFNKSDVPMAASTPPPDVHAVASVYGSAMRGINMQALYQLVDELLGMDSVQLLVSSDLAESPELWQQLSRLGRVADVRQENAGRLVVRLEVERRVAERTRNQLLADYPHLTVQILVSNESEADSLTTAGGRLNTDLQNGEACSVVMEDVGSET